MRVLLAVAIILSSHAARADEAGELKACNAGKADQCEALAVRNPTNAVTYLEKACALKSGRACNNLGVAWSEGKDGATVVDHQKARGYYERACGVGHGLGCFNLGNIYRLGEGVAIDLKRAFDNFGKSCDLKEAGGCTELAILYYEGKVVPRDVDKATSLLEKACELGSKAACKNLEKLKSK